MIKKDFSLKQFNTFGVDVRAKYFSWIRKVEDLKNLSLEAESMILGGGSNMLLTQDLNRHVLLNKIDGIERIDESQTHCLVEVGGGVDWHSFVQWSIEQDLGGLENLSLIPGTVGASPIQNIGAYGVELKDVFQSLLMYDFNTESFVELYHADCGFGYRDSIFKHRKDPFMICKVRFRLSKKHTINTDYGAISAKLTEWDIRTPSIRDVSHAVIEIRSSKLPDPKVIGNSGSFFKNPIVTREKKLALAELFEDLKYYDLGEGNYKIPAGWMIEKCGFKGKRVGNVGCYKNQALVIVNHGNASGTELLDFAHSIIEKVNDTFGISLNPEVNIF